MTNRSKHLPYYTFLIGLLIISCGFNFVFYNRICILQEFILRGNPWVSVEEVDILKQELDRLENLKYEIIPNNF